MVMSHLQPPNVFLIESSLIEVPHRDDEHWVYRSTIHML